MAEEKRDVSDPTFGVAGRFVVGGIAAVVVGSITTSFLDRPEQIRQEGNRKSIERHEEQQRDIAALRRELTDVRDKIAKLRDSLGTDAVELANVNGRIDVMEAKETERWREVSASLTRLENQIGGVVGYLTEEERVRKLSESNAR